MNSSSEREKMAAALLRRVPEQSRPQLTFALMVEHRYGRGVPIGEAVSTAAAHIRRTHPAFEPHYPAELLELPPGTG